MKSVSRDCVIVAVATTTVLSAAPQLSFWKSVETTVAGAPLGGTALADLNFDLIPDLIVNEHGSGTLRVALGRRDGSFGDATAYAVSPGPGHIAVGDFNGDARIDVVVASTGIAVLLGNGNGTLQPPVVSSGSAKDAVVADFNRDGRLDIASVGKNSTSIVPETVDIYSGAGDGTFAAPVTLYTTDRHPAALAVADFNGDSWPDLAFGERDIRQLRIMLNGGGVSFTTAGSATIEVGPSRVAAGDLDGNGTADLVTANFTGTISVLLGRGDGTLTAAQTYAVGPTKCGSRPCPSARWVEVADVDGTLGLDVVSTNDGAGTVSVLPNSGSGALASPIVLDASRFGNAAFAADMNTDGALDVIAIHSQSAHTDPGARIASVFLNRAGGGLRGGGAGQGRGAAPVFPQAVTGVK